MAINILAVILAVSHQNSQINRSSHKLKLHQAITLIVDSDNNSLGITEPPRQTLTATNSSVTSSGSENEHTDNYEALNSNSIAKRLSLMLRISHCLKKASNINKEPKRDMIICLKTDKQDSSKQVKILSRAGKVGKSKSGKYKSHWNVSDDQGYTKMIDFENDVAQWEEIMSDYDDETTQLPSRSIDHCD